MIETETITVLDSWSKKCNREECKELCDSTKQELNKKLNNGFRIKCVTSYVLENKGLVHYVLERESK